MPLYKNMARPTKDPKEAKGKESEKPLPEPSSEAQRPGTSGTEMLLTTNRRRASEKFQQAQRAERTYKAKKRSQIARVDAVDARMHFKEAARHLGIGLKMTFSVVTKTPYFFAVKTEERRAKSEEERKKKSAERKKRLEEALARENALESDDGLEDEKTTRS
jgi:hypothetical protein